MNFFKNVENNKTPDNNNEVSADVFNYLEKNINVSANDKNEIVANKEMFLNDLEKVFKKHMSEMALAEWSHFYEEQFGVSVDMSKIKIPERQEEFDRLIVVPEEVNLNNIVEVCKKHFKVINHIGSDVDNFDLDNGISDFRPEGSYAVWLEESDTASSDYTIYSGERLRDEGIRTTTLKEYLLYHLKYFIETGKHLDNCYSGWKANKLRGLVLCGDSLVKHDNPLYKKTPSAYYSNDDQALCISGENFDIYRLYTACRKVKL